MNTRGFQWSAAIVLLLLGGLPAASLIQPASADDEQFTLTRAVPDDVLFCVAVRHNPEREFLDRYWQEVFDALEQSGVGGDLLELISSFLGSEQRDEFERIKERASQLLAGVDWKELGGGEFLFSERLPTPLRTPTGGVQVGLAHMVWLFRGEPAGAAKNFQGLTDILESITEEVNKAVGRDVLELKRISRGSTDVVTLQPPETIPNAPPLQLALLHRDDVIGICVGREMLSDVLGLLEGTGSKKALGETRRFKAAFAKLPTPEDTMVFFDMQAMLAQVRGILDTISEAVGATRDTTLNTGMNAEANKFHDAAIAAYRQGEIKEALAETEKAYEVAPHNSIVLYNLACFHSLLGHKNAALGWLEKAVAGGFYAPAKISTDPDLNSLRQEPRYNAAQAEAAKLAKERYAEDVVINSSKQGEAYKLSQQAWDVYDKEKDYKQALKLVEQAHDIAPNDSRVLYYLACFHALLDHQDKGLEFLERAVDGGFYCPEHITKDPDLESIRNDKRYDAALAAARRKAAESGTRGRSGKVTLVKGLVERLMNAAGIVDYVATVETTDGYATRSETIAVLMPDAQDRPIYPVFTKRGQLTRFDRFLPEETVSFSVSGGFDLGAFYKFAEDTIRDAGPQGADLLARWEQIQTNIGFDVKRDVLSWFDGDSVSVTLADDQGWVLLVKVADERIAREKIAAALEFVTEKLGEVMGANPALAAMMGIRSQPLDDDRLDGFQSIYFSMSPQPIVWGVTDEHLIVGSSVHAVTLCLDTAKGEHPNIRANARVMSEMLVPDGPFSSVNLTDQRRLGDQIAMGIGIASMAGGMMGQFIPDETAKRIIGRIAGMLAKLSPVARKIDFYKSSAAYTTFDGSAWRTYTVTHYASPEERSGSAER